MELTNDTNNDNVVYEAQDGGERGGPMARDLFLYVAAQVGNPKVDIESVRNELGAAGPLPQKGEARTVCGLSQYEPITLVFFERSNGTLTPLPGGTYPGATDGGRYRLKETATLGQYEVEPY